MAIDYLSTFDFEIQYRPGQRHLNADALSRRPCDIRCKWCKGWKSQERGSFVDVGVQTVMHVPCQDNEQPVNSEEPVGARCATVKLEPTWTSTFLREQQEAGFDLKVIIGWKEAGIERCVASELCCEDLVVSVARLLFRNRVLCANGKVTEVIRLLTTSFFPRVFDRLPLMLIIVIRLQVIVVYGRP